MLLLSSVGEFPLVEESERRLLLESGLESLTAKADGWVGVAAPSNRLAVRYAQSAEELGAAALVAVPPYYLHPTPAAIAQYFRAIRECTKLPLLASNVPSFVGYPLAPEVVHRLARERVLEGMTDVAGFLASIEAFRRGAPEEFAVFSGEDALVAEAIEKGASGAVIESANVVPKLAVALVRAAVAHETARAAELQLLLTRLAEALRAGPFPSTTKFLAGQAWGAPAGYRSPYPVLTPEEERVALEAFEPLRPLLRPFL